MQEVLVKSIFKNKALNSSMQQLRRKNQTIEVRNNQMQKNTKITEKQLS